MYVSVCMCVCMCVCVCVAYGVFVNMGLVIYCTCVNMDFVIRVYTGSSIFDELH